MKLRVIRPTCRKSTNSLATKTNATISQIGQSHDSDSNLHRTYDGGKDGVKHVTLWNPQGEGESQARVLAEVKSGGFTLNEVKAFCRTMNKVEAVAGIFITIESPTDGMRQEAADMETFSHNNVTYPRLQFWQIDDNYFKNPDIVKQLLRLPPEWLRPIHKSERHFEDTRLKFKSRKKDMAR